MQIFKNIALRLRGKFPSKLPVGKEAFDQFSVSIFQTYSLPDLPSYRNAIATMIMHLSPEKCYATKSYFAQSIRKAMANQTAYAIIMEIKKAEEDAEPQESAVEEGRSADAH